MDREWTWTGSGSGPELDKMNKLQFLYAIPVNIKNSHIRSNFKLTVQELDVHFIDILLLGRAENDSHVHFLFNNYLQHPRECYLIF